jgi:NitT/TauT family transport system permease protein
MSRAALSRPEAIGLPVAGLVLAIAGWWLVTDLFDIRVFFLPGPADVATAFREHPSYLAREGWTTLVQTLAGFGIATVAGLATALLLASSRRIEQTMLPLVVALNAIPKVALAPLLVLWLGFEAAPKISLAALICFFPIVVAGMAGLTSTPADLGELASSLSATRWQAFVKVRIPWALPQVFVGLKLAVTLAVIGTVVAEFRTPNSGLGMIIVNATQQIDTPLAFAAITVLMVMSIVLFYGTALAERLLLPWARQTVAART